MEAMQDIRFQFKLNGSKHKKTLVNYLFILLVVFVLAFSVNFILNCQLCNAKTDDYLTLTASGGNVDISCGFDIYPNNNIYFSTDNGNI